MSVHMYAFTLHPGCYPSSCSPSHSLFLHPLSSLRGCFPTQPQIFSPQHTSSNKVAPIPARPYLPVPVKWCNFLKHSNIWVYGGHSYSNFYSQIIRKTSIAWPNSTHSLLKSPFCWHPWHKSSCFQRNTVVQISPAFKDNFLPSQSRWGGSWLPLARSGWAQLYTDSNFSCQAKYLSVRFFAEGLVWANTSKKSCVVTVSSWIPGKLLLSRQKDNRQNIGVGVLGRLLGQVCRQCRHPVLDS